MIGSGLTCYATGLICGMFLWVWFGSSMDHFCTGKIGEGNIGYGAVVNCQGGGEI